MSVSDTSHTNLPAVADRAPSANGSSLELAPLPHEPSTLLSPPAPAAPTGASALAVLKALRRYWMLACGLGLLCSVSAATATWLAMPASKYTIRALLRVSSLPPSVVFPSAEGRADFQTFQKTQLALVKSRLVLTAALRDSQVANLVIDKRPSAIEWLEQEVKTDFSLAPEILRVSMNGDQTEELKTLVNAVVKAYLDEIVNSDRKKRRDALNHVEEVSREYEESLHRKRLDLRNLMELVGASESSALALKQRFALEQHNLSQSELMTLQSDVRRAQIELSRLQEKQKQGANLPVADAALEKYIREHPDLKKYEAQKSQLQDELAAIRREALWGPDAPVVQKKKDEIEYVESALVRKTNELRPKLRDELRGKIHADMEEKVEQLRERIVLMKEQEKQLVKDVERQAAAVLSINRGSQDIVTNQHAIAQTEDIAKRIASQAEALKVELRAPERVVVFEEATVSQSDDTKKRVAASGAAGVGGLGLVLFCIAWREVRYRRVNSVDEVVNGLGMNLMGTLPALPRRLTHRTGAAEGSADSTWQYQLTESVDACRTLLLHAARKEALKVVMITSAVSGEGKTSLATQLAVSLGRTGRNVLLIDSDLRNPAAHRVFDLPRGPGLCELLRGEAELADVIRPTTAGQLAMICAGRCHPEAILALAQKGIQPILDELKQQYDFIIVDSCPVLPVADALLIGQHVDAVIFSVLQEVSRLPMVAAAYQRLHMLGIRMLGAVVLGTQEDAYGQIYRYLEPTEN